MDLSALKFILKRLSRAIQDAEQRKNERLQNLVDTFKHLQPHSEQNYKKIKINSVIDEAIKLADRIIIMNEGQIVEDGSKDEVIKKINPSS